jgi:glycine/D-amino acid oxidase-like deaminating enzyme
VTFDVIVIGGGAAGLAAAAALEAGDVLSKPDTSLESCRVGESGRNLSEEARSMARAFVSGFDAADPERVSIHSIAEELRGRRGHACRPGSQPAPRRHG